MTLGTKQAILESPAGRALQAEAYKLAQDQTTRSAERQRRRSDCEDAESEGAVEASLVRLRSVNITYGTPEQPRKILEAIDWDIKSGERWLLAGHNGEPRIRAQITRFH